MERHPGISWGMPPKQGRPTQIPAWRHRTRESPASNASSLGPAYPDPPLESEVGLGRWRKQGFPADPDLPLGSPKWVWVSGESQASVLRALEAPSYPVVLRTVVLRTKVLKPWENTASLVPHHQWVRQGPTWVLPNEVDTADPLHSAMSLSSINNFKSALNSINSEALQSCWEKVGIISLLQIDFQAQKAEFHCPCWT